MSLDKEFIPYKQALALKELGFDEPCMSSRDMNNGEGLIQLPLYQQAFRWFREKYDLMVVIQTMVKDSWLLRIESIDSTTINGVYNGKRWHLDDDEDYVDPTSYEEAELACLEKLIEICKEKKS